MRPIHMTIGGRPLVRHDFPGGVRVRFEDAGRARGPAVRRALAGDTGEARKADRPSRLMPRPAGAPGGGATETAREAEVTTETSFPTMAEIRRRSDEATAEIFRPLHHALVALALGALVAAAAFTTVSLARLDRQIAEAARV